MDILHTCASMNKLGSIFKTMLSMDIFWQMVDSNGDFTAYINISLSDKKKKKNIFKFCKRERQMDLFNMLHVQILMQSKCTNYGEGKCKPV